MFNQVNIIGNLVRTPELRSTPGGTQLTDVTVALNNKFTDASGRKVEETTFVDVTVWGKGAESLCRYKKQGDLILVEGRLKQDKWVDKESGKNRSKLSVVAQRVTFMPGGGKKDGKSSSSGRSDNSNHNNNSDPGGYDDYATSLPDSGEEPPF